MLLLAGGLLAGLFAVPAQAAGGSISGTVRDNGGIGVANAQVMLYGSAREGDVWAQTRTDEQGHFDFPSLQTRDWRVCVYATAATEQRCWRDSETVTEATPIPVGAGEVPGIDLTVGPSTRISGVALLAGQPVSDATVTAYSLTDGGWTSRSRDDTDESGAFDLTGLPAGTYRLGVSDGLNSRGLFMSEFWTSTGMVGRVEDAGDISLERGQKVAGLVAQLRTGGSITGAVILPERRSAGGIAVSLYCPRAAGWTQCNTTATGDDGSFRLARLDAGSYRLAVNDDAGIRRERYSSAIWSSAASIETATDIVVGENQAVSGIDVRLGLRTIITGRVTDVYGEPAREVAVSLYGRDPSTGRWTLLGNDVGVDRDGVYARDGVRAGTYCLAAESYGTYRTVWWRDGTSDRDCTPFTVGATGTVTRDFVLPFTTSVTARSKPRVLGTPRAGKTLRAVVPTWSSTPTATYVQWLAGGKAIPRATSPRLLLSPRFVGRRISVRVVAIATGANPGVATSQPTAPVRRR